MVRAATTATVICCEAEAFGDEGDGHDWDCPGSEGETPIERRQRRQNSLRATQRAENYRRRVLVDGRLVAPDPTEGPPLVHGKTYTYQHWGCRCEKCETVNKIAMKRHPRYRKPLSKAKVEAITFQLWVSLSARGFVEPSSLNGDQRRVAGEMILRRLVMVRKGQLVQNPTATIDQWRGLA